MALGPGRQKATIANVGRNAPCYIDALDDDGPVIELEKRHLGCMRCWRDRQKLRRLVGEVDDDVVEGRARLEKRDPRPLRERAHTRVEQPQRLRRAEREEHRRR